MSGEDDAHKNNYSVTSLIEFHMIGEDDVHKDSNSVTSFMGFYMVGENLPTGRQVMLIKSII